MGLPVMEPKKKSRVTMRELHLLSQPCAATPPLSGYRTHNCAYTLLLVSFLETSRNVKFDVMLLFLGCIYNIRYPLVKSTVPQQDQNVLRENRQDYFSLPLLPGVQCDSNVSINAYRVDLRYTGWSWTPVRGYCGL